jgi:hypothetical protein
MSDSLRTAGARRRVTPTPTSETLLTMNATCLASVAEDVETVAGTLTMDATAVASTPTAV